MNLPWLSEEETIARMNELGSRNEPFFFLISFDKNKNLVIEEQKLEQFPVYFSFPLMQRSSRHPPSEVDILDTQMPDKKDYKIAFDKVQQHIGRGDTYLLNLTCKVPISLKGGLQDVFIQAKAPYKTYVQDHFISFSPEPFIKIEKNRAYTFPMKGTINANEENAADKILSDEKEKAEHYTIVDLLRNDLSQIGFQTKVNRFRYLSPIQRKEGNLLQVSSEIACKLEKGWESHIGSLLFKILPAGSISGAPKKRTVEIINQVEAYDRKWYTGVSGVYKNHQLQSAVLIRYIGKSHSKYYYCSGGGITYRSQWEKEYNEIRSKIYIPIG